VSQVREAGKIARRRPPRFDLIAGNVCLDFVNTLDERYIKPKELLETYADLARFGEDAGLLDSRRIDQLRERSEAEPERAQETLLWARELREALHDIFFAIVHKQPVPTGALAKLNADVQSAAGHMSLVPAARGASKSGFEWEFDDLREFDSVVWPIARAAGGMLTSDQLPYVRTCFSKSCEWFFLDTSKNHHRRWCDMTRCGNRAKVRSFYARQKKQSSSS
jgi:predicted RNA-binding Zn ribbon-like protein